MILFSLVEYDLKNRRTRFKRKKNLIIEEPRGYMNVYVCGELESLLE